jgi:hypothetical protein
MHDLLKTVAPEALFDFAEEYARHVFVKKKVQQWGAKKCSSKPAPWNAVHSVFS